MVKKNKHKKNQTLFLEEIGASEFGSLYHLKQPVIILLADNGPAWHNQTGCCACRHHEVNGYLIPMVHPFGMKTWGWTNCDYIKCLGVIREFVNQQEGFSDCQIQEHEEAWVEADCKFNGRPAKIVITWENCD